MGGDSAHPVLGALHATPPPDSRAHPCSAQPCTILTRPEKACIAARFFGQRIFDSTRRMFKLDRVSARQECSR